MSINTRVIASGNRNGRILITGILTAKAGPLKVVDTTDLSCDAFKIESAIWIIQEKLGLRLWWGRGESIEGYPEPTVDNLIFVMESRNTVRFDQGLDSPRRSEKWDRCIWMDSFNMTVPDIQPKHFTVILEIDKQ